jgi:hypothetical protein
MKSYESLGEKWRCYEVSMAKRSGDDFASNMAKD